MNKQPGSGAGRRVPGRQTLFATSAVAAAVAAALHFGVPTQNANAAAAPLDQSIPPASVQTDISECCTNHPVARRST